MHYEPLRPHRCSGIGERYEFTHGTGIVCVYAIKTMDFIKEIPVGERIPMIPNGEFRCEIGGRGAFLEDGRYYLCAGWRQREDPPGETEIGLYH